MTRPLHRPPTARQLACLRAIAAHLRAHGYAPTYRELGHALGIAHNSAMLHCLALERRRLLVMEYGGYYGDKAPARALRLTPAGRLWVLEQEAVSALDAARGGP